MNSPASTELIARHLAGKLTPAQSERFFRQRLNPRLIMPSTFPINHMLHAEIRDNAGPMFAPPRLRPGPLITITVDDQPAQYDGRNRGEPLNPTWGPRDCRFQFSSNCAPGKHLVRVKGTLPVDVPYTILMPPGQNKQYQLPIDFTQTIEVVTKDVSTFVTPVWEESAAAKIAASARAYATYSDSRRRLRLRLAVSDTPIPVGFVISARVSGTDEYRSTNRLLVSPWQLQQDMELSSIEYPADPASASLDILLRAEPSKLFFQDLDQCFAGDLEWTALPLIASEDRLDPQWMTTALPPSHVIDARDRIQAASNPIKQADP